jgi:WD40 repeat protein
MQTKQGPQWRWLTAVALVLGVCQHAPGQRAEPWLTLRGHNKGVKALAFSPDGKTLASGSFGGSVRLWEVASGRERVRWRSGGDTRNSPPGTFPKP